MKWVGWQKALKEGRVVHDWSPLRLEANGHVAEIFVSADAVRVRSPNDSTTLIREGCGAMAAQLLADSLGGLMVTAKIVVARHTAATVQLDPMLQPFVKRGGNVTNTTAAEVSKAVDDRIAGNRVRSRPGPWIVSNVGKHFVLDRRCGGPVRNFPKLPCSIIFGFVVATADCRGAQLLWAGTPTYPLPSETAWRVIQGASNAHSFGPDFDQDDCETTCLLVKKKCILDGVEVDTARLYTEAALSPLVLDDGIPLPWSRHPLVPPLAKPSTADTVGPRPVVPPPSGPAPHFIPDAKTPVTAEQLRAALAAKLPDASPGAIACLLGHWDLETAAGRATHCFNLTNVKARGNGSDGQCWTYFQCGEELPIAYARHLAADPRATIIREYTDAKGTPKASMKFRPDHPACCFRAFASLADGVADYVRIMRHTFPRSWASALAGDPRAMGHWLAVEHFYTANETGYTTVLQARSSKYLRQFPGNPS